MGQNTAISWTDHTLNFWHGCFKVSPGCQHCYADTLSKRYGREIWGPASTTPRLLTKTPWKDCLKWDAQARKDGVRRKVFAMSMGDFYEDHPMVSEWRENAFDILANFTNLDVQLLTKRPENIRRFSPESWLESWPAHVWIGTSIENQATADKRVRDLYHAGIAATRFLSIEPMLEDIRVPYIEKLHWIIVGGESGPGCRPFQTQWAENILAQCLEWDVKFFMKQLGGHPNKRHELSDFPENLRVQEFPTSYFG